MERADHRIHGLVRTGHEAPPLTFKLLRVSPLRKIAVDCSVIQRRGFVKQPMQSCDASINVVFEDRKVAFVFFRDWLDVLSHGDVLNVPCSLIQGPNDSIHRHIHAFNNGLEITFMSKRIRPLSQIARKSR